MQQNISVPQLIAIADEYDETADPSGMSAGRRFLDFVFEKLSPKMSDEDLPHHNS